MDTDNAKRRSGLPTRADHVPTLAQRRRARLQYLLPKRALTRLAGWLAERRGGALTTGTIRWFIRRYRVDMAEAAHPDPAVYATFNDFFVRALRADARPLATADLICPVDGAISQVGPIELGEIVQAKGHHYSAHTLLAHRDKVVTPWHEGTFATLYLSPRDYHRIHMPCDGRLRRMTYVPGEFFSVNPATAYEIPGLFARNERVVCEFVSPDVGRFVMVLVGATIVGSMSTVWHGVVDGTDKAASHGTDQPATHDADPAAPQKPDASDAPGTPAHAARRGTLRRYDYGETGPMLRKGDEMGQFRLGSTVVLLFEPDRMTFDSSWEAGMPVRLGQAMGTFAGQTQA